MERRDFLRGGRLTAALAAGALAISLPGQTNAERTPVASEESVTTIEALTAPHPQHARHSSRELFHYNGSLGHGSDETVIEDVYPTYAQVVLTSIPPASYRIYHKKIQTDMAFQATCAGGNHTGYTVSDLNDKKYKPYVKFYGDYVAPQPHWPWTVLCTKNGYWNKLTLKQLELPDPYPLVADNRNT